jgi:hypothetical protein
MVNFYYQSGDNYRVYDTTTNKYETVNSLTYKNTANFYIFNDYESNDNGLKLFARHFRDWSEEINASIKFDYSKCKDHASAIRQICVYNCPRLEEFEDIDVKEFAWIERCNNGGLQILLNKEKQQCYGYDFKACYLSILGKEELRFDIPSKKGKECMLSDLGNMYKLKVGYYRVKITSDDKRFLFAYSKENVYTNISLYYAFKCKKDGLNVNIELIQDGQFNAYIYGSTAKEGIHASSYVFNKLYEKLMTLKYKYPKNQLVKFIASSLWGKIAEFKKRFLSMDQIIEHDISCSHDIYDEEADYWIRSFDASYELIKKKKPYANNCARIKAFLTSKAREIIANVGMLHIDDVVRIHTDSVTFNQRHDDVMTKFKSYPDLIPEDKITGLIKFQSVNSYYNFTKNEKHGKFNLDRV